MVSDYYRFTNNDIQELLAYFRQYPAQKDNFVTLNKLFYYSLFDYSVIFDSRNSKMMRRLFPPEAQKAYKDDMKNLLGQVVPENSQFLTNFDQFEIQIVSTDKLSRIILLTELRHRKMEIDPRLSEYDGCFDLELQKDNIKIELKRIWAWTNFKNYITRLCHKVHKLNKTEQSIFLFIVASPHPFVIEDLFGNCEELEIFNKYIHNVVTSHYTSEFLLNKYLRCDNIKFIIQHIDKYGNVEYNVKELCDRIKQFYDKTKQKT
jgi:hypothetical protein